MNFISNFIINFSRIFTSFLGSASMTGVDVSSSLSLTEGSNNIENGEVVKGSTTLTTATALVTTCSNASAYDTSVTQAYVESMNEKETQELILELEKYENSYEKPKVLVKKINNNTKNHY